MDYGAGWGWMMRVGEGCVRRARAKARVRGLGRTLERARGEARGVNAQFNAIQCNSTDDVLCVNRRMDDVL